MKKIEAQSVMPISWVTDYIIPGLSDCKTPNFQKAIKLSSLQIKYDMNTNIINKQRRAAVGAVGDGSSESHTQPPGPCSDPQASHRMPRLTVLSLHTQ